MATNEMIETIREGGLIPGGTFKGHWPVREGTKETAVVIRYKICLRVSYLYSVHCCRNNTKQKKCQEKFAITNHSVNARLDRSRLDLRPEPWYIHNGNPAPFPHL